MWPWPAVSLDMVVVIVPMLSFYFLLSTFYFSLFVNGDCQNPTRSFLPCLKLAPYRSTLWYSAGAGRFTNKAGLGPFEHTLGPFEKGARCRGATYF